MESPDLEAQLQRWRRRCLQERCFFLSVLALGGLLFYFTVLKHRVCAILVEGREVVYVPDEATARSLLLELLREKSPRPDDDSAGFVQEVTWRKVIRRGQRLSTPEEASPAAGNQVRGEPASGGRMGRWAAAFSHAQRGGGDAGAGDPQGPLCRETGQPGR